MQKLLKLEFSKSTKGTHVFSDGDKVSLYFPKEMTSEEGEPLFTPAPKVIYVTVTVE
jgi:hypothetical protein